MTIDTIQEIIRTYVSLPLVSFDIDRNIFNLENGRKRYNEIINENVENQVGIYVWTDDMTSEVYYIGMAGKINSDGSVVNHSLNERLKASRCKDNETKKDVQTNDYVKKFMFENNIARLKFYVMYTMPGEPPSYIEALLLYKYYKQNGRLPLLNNSF